MAKRHVKVDLSPQRFLSLRIQDSMRTRRPFAILCRSQIAEERVKPERQRKKADGTYVLRKPLPQHGGFSITIRKKLYSLLRDLSNAIVIPKTSKYTMPRMASTTYIFSHALAVFASDDDGLYGLLTSELHRAWARFPWKHDAQ